MSADKGWECAAAKGTSSEAAYAHCDWPHCGCDPYANRVMDALEEASPQTALQPISCAPKDGTPILIWCEESIQDDTRPKPYVTTSRWVEEKRERWEWVSDTQQELRTEDASHWDCWELPTHWMHLPEPPK
jgi:hypothetical protein